MAAAVSLHAIGGVVDQREGELGEPDQQQADGQHASGMMAGADAGHQGQQQRGHRHEQQARGLEGHGQGFQQVHVGLRLLCGSCLQQSYAAELRARSGLFCKSRPSRHDNFIEIREHEFAHWCLSNDLLGNCSVGKCSQVS